MEDPWREDQPIYRQIRDRIIASILEGDLPEGSPLPSVRALAVEARVNPLTVSKAYQELQALGVAEARRGLGLFVVEGVRAKLSAEERAVFLAQEWPRVVARMKRLGLNVADLLSAVQEEKP